MILASKIKERFGDIEIFRLDEEHLEAVKTEKININKKMKEL